MKIWDLLKTWGLIATAALALHGTPALASDDYPNRTITMIVPFSPGSAAGSASGGMRVHVVREGNRVSSTLTGPPNLPGQKPADLAVPFTLDVDRSTEKAVLPISGQPVPLNLREYSPWLRLTFRAGWFTTVRGISRFRAPRDRVGG